MRIRIGTIAWMTVVLACAGDAWAQKAQPTKAAPMPATKTEVLDDVNRAFGFVPEFIKAMPDSFLVGFWTTMKTFQLNPNTSLDGKTKELIGLAVASQVPCEYCIYFHTLAARKNGATEQEIKEAVGMAAMTRTGSTMLNGLQIDRAQFRKDIDRIMKMEPKGKASAQR